MNIIGECFQTSLRPGFRHHFGSKNGVRSSLKDERKRLLFNNAKIPENSGGWRGGEGGGGQAPRAARCWRRQNTQVAFSLEDQNEQRQNFAPPIRIMKW